MYKIRKIKFIDHKILHNLTLNFCNREGKAADTVIIAGENGTGKSTIINELFDFASNNIANKFIVELEDENHIFKIKYLYNDDASNGLIYAFDEAGKSEYVGSDIYKNKYKFNGIFSDVEINFNSGNVSSVTSSTLDEIKSSVRSTPNLLAQTKQLLIDIQAQDDADVSYAVNKNPKTVCEDLNVPRRMKRFTNAFSIMFDNLEYDRIENIDNHKEIIFKKNEEDIPIENLSSGEKQIIYISCFLLKDVNAMNGAFVFIDEPEISLHPSWQKKILDFYKNIFTDENGIQTSQIFFVTHSPFIIHNENRRNDKVIVLERDETGEIIVKDRPSYYNCNSTTAIEDAFYIDDFSADKSTVYLEGRTDEMYFNKTLKVFNIDAPFEFKWVGYLDESGQEVFTGSSSLDKAFQFLVAKKLPIINICLKDCDTNQKKEQNGNVIKLSVETYENSKKIKKGIENALVLDSIENFQKYYSDKSRTDDYNCTTSYQEFNKMELCRDICSMDDEQAKKILVHLKREVEKLITIYSDGQNNVG